MEDKSLPSLAGTVYGMQKSSQNRGQASLEVWDFQVGQNDASGNLVLLPVEMRGLSFAGNIQDGQKVEVYGKWQKGTLLASKVHNLTTGAWIEQTEPTPLQRVVIALFVIVFLVFFAITVLMVVFHP